MSAEGPTPLTGMGPMVQLLQFSHGSSIMVCRQTLPSEVYGLCYTFVASMAGHLFN